MNYDVSLPLIVFYITSMPTNILHGILYFSTISILKEKNKKLQILQFEYFKLFCNLL